MATIDGKKAATAAEKAKYEAEQDKRILEQLAQEEAALDADRAKQAKMAAERAAKGAAGAAVVEKGLKKMITDSGANPKDAGVAEMFATEVFKAIAGDESGVVSELDLEDFINQNGGDVIESDVAEFFDVHVSEAADRMMSLPLFKKAIKKCVA